MSEKVVKEQRRLEKAQQAAQARHDMEFMLKIWNVGTQIINNDLEALAPWAVRIAKMKGCHVDGVFACLAVGMVMNKLGAAVGADMQDMEKRGETPVMPEWIKRVTAALGLGLEGEPEKQDGPIDSEAEYNARAARLRAQHGIIIEGG